MTSIETNKFVSVNGHAVSYMEAGLTTKPTVIFIHGFPFNKSIWTSQFEALKDYYHLIAYDLIGFGDSEEGSESLTLDLYTDNLVQFMDALSIEKAIVCGHGIGGNILLAFAERFPLRVEAMILTGTHAKSENSELKDGRVNAIAQLQAGDIESYIEDTVKSVFAYISFTAKREEIAEIKNLIKNNSVSGSVKMLQLLNERKDSTSKLSEIKVPVLIMVGKKDSVTPPAQSEILHENIVDSVLELIDYAGHLPNLENPLEFNRNLKKFLDKTTASSRLPHFDRSEKKSA